MNVSTLQRTLSWGGALVLAVVFLYAGIPKMLDPSLFGQSIHRYDMLPGPAVSLMAIFLPWLECCAAVFLLIPTYRRGASLLIAAMLLLFLAAIANALLRDLDISCGCFSRSGHEDSIGWTHIVRNLGLLALAGTVLWAARTKPTEASA